MEDEFFHVWFTALLYGYEAVGFGEYEFSASGTSNGYAPVYARPTVNPGSSFLGPVQKTDSTYWRLTTHGRIEVNLAQHTHFFFPDAAGINGHVPGMLELTGVWPNPANPSTHIHFKTGQAGKVTVHIYDMAGRLVRRLLETDMTVGSQSIFWNGCDGHDQSLPSGAYYFLVAREQDLVRGKVMLVK